MGITAGTPTPKNNSKVLELLSFGSLLGIGGALMSYHHFSEAVGFFVAGFAVLAYTVHAEARQIERQWLRILTACLGYAVVVIAHIFVLGIANESRDEFLGERMRGDARESVAAVKEQEKQHGIVITPRFIEIEPANLKTSKQGKEKRPPQPSTIIQTVTPYGNLQQRTFDLAQAIMADLYVHGMPVDPMFPMQLPPGFDPVQKLPRKSSEYAVWDYQRVAHFRWKFLKPVHDLRDEFAQLHIRDEDLDSILDMQESFDRQRGGSPIPAEVGADILSVSHIVKVAYGLKKLANQAGSSPANP